MEAMRRVRFSAPCTDPCEKTSVSVEIGTVTQKHKLSEIVSMLLNGRCIKHARKEKINFD